VVVVEVVVMMVLLRLLLPPLLLLLLALLLLLPLLLLLLLLALLLAALVVGGALTALVGLALLVVNAVDVVSAWRSTLAMRLRWLWVVNRLALGLALDATHDECSQQTRNEVLTIWA